jgi:hypothetical protein
MVIAVGVPTVGVTLTALTTCVEGPLHPLAVTCILTGPENPLAQVITPAEVIEPAALLLSDQLKPVLFVAVVAYVVWVAPFVNWHVGSVPEEIVMAVGVPTVGFTFTVLITCKEGPLHPFAVTCILTEPEKPLAHVITPVDAPIEPAAALLKDQLNPVLFVAVVEYVVWVAPFINWQLGSVP